MTARIGGNAQGFMIDSSYISCNKVYWIQVRKGENADQKADQRYLKKYQIHPLLGECFRNCEGVCYLALLKKEKKEA